MNAGHFLIGDIGITIRRGFFNNIRIRVCDLADVPAFDLKIETGSGLWSAFERKVHWLGREIIHAL